MFWMRTKAKPCFWLPWPWAGDSRRTKHTSKSRTGDPQHRDDPYDVGVICFAPVVASAVSLLPTLCLNQCDSSARPMPGFALLRLRLSVDKEPESDGALRQSAATPVCLFHQNPFQGGIPGAWRDVGSPFCRRIQQTPRYSRWARHHSTLFRSAGCERRLALVLQRCCPPCRRNRYRLALAAESDEIDRRNSHPLLSESD